MVYSSHSPKSKSVVLTQHRRNLCTFFMSSSTQFSRFNIDSYPHAGADPGFFLGGGALVSCSTSTPINHIVCRIPVVLENRRSSRGGGERTPCTLPLDPPLSRLNILTYNVCLLSVKANQWSN